MVGRGGSLFDLFRKEGLPSATQRGESSDSSQKSIVLLALQILIPPPNLPTWTLRLLLPGSRSRIPDFINRRICSSNLPDSFVA
jgi:hypothetical protein